MSMSITQQIALARINFKKEEKQLKTLSNNLTGLYINLMNKFVAAKNDVSGSETTEKIGMVVVAVVIVGLLIAAMNQFMPQLFQSIIDLAKTKFEEMVGGAKTT